MEATQGRSSEARCRAGGVWVQPTGPRVELQTAPALLLTTLTTQHEYIEASRKHVALLNEGIAKRDRSLHSAGRGFPTSYKHLYYVIPAKGEDESAKQLEELAERVTEAQAYLAGLQAK